ncbi:hypothetical protein [Rhodovulum adriaticum]|uniref:Flagellar export protein FliJ n=1 Tax=Rhodovulum adriaticum TaxID=35804 RepID=A0A4R2P157_RHOAD|nr:hypothetical protein [Rhodovulum adriaticum]TCP27654.1 hypothetical protein EV656_101563 [Rhodovulum adriaticum]
MTRPDPRLVGLARISGALRAAKLLRLAEANARLRRVEQELAALDAPEMAAAAPGDIAALAVTGAARARWCAARRAALIAAQDRARAARDAALAEARGAVGRDAAVARLCERDGFRHPGGPDR